MDHWLDHFEVYVVLLNKLGHFPTDKPESHASSGSNQPWSLPKIIPLLGVLPMKNDEKCIYIYSSPFGFPGRYHPGPIWMFMMFMMFIPYVSQISPSLASWSDKDSFTAVSPWGLYLMGIMMIDQKDLVVPGTYFLTNPDLCGGETHSCNNRARILSTRFFIGKTMITGLYTEFQFSMKSRF